MKHRVGEGVTKNLSEGEGSKGQARTKPATKGPGGGKKEGPPKTESQPTSPRSRNHPGWGNPAPPTEPSPTPSEVHEPDHVPVVSPRGTGDINPLVVLVKA